MRHGRVRHHDPLAIEPARRLAVARHDDVARIEVERADQVTDPIGSDGD
jgi:hypothetical protein